MFTSLNQNVEQQQSFNCDYTQQITIQNDNEGCSWQQVLHPNDFSLFDDEVQNINDNNCEKNSLKIAGCLDLKADNNQDCQDKSNALTKKQVVPDSSQIVDFKEQKDIFDEPSNLLLNSSEVNSQNQESNRNSQTNIEANNSNTARVSLDHLKRIANIGKYNDPEKYNRFGRAEDRNLFSKLKQLCAARNRDISDFWIHNRGVDYILDEILDEVLSQISYKGDKDQLLRRIRKVARFKTFSIRDRKLLKKLVEHKSKSKT